MAYILPRVIRKLQDFAGKSQERLDDRNECLDRPKADSGLNTSISKVIARHEQLKTEPKHNGDEHNVTVMKFMSDLIDMSERLEWCKCSCSAPARKDLKEFLKAFADELV